MSKIPPKIQQLNPQQQQAVMSIQGPLLLLAGAGSGKTRVIIARIGHMIESHQILPHQILAVTFTNKAAEEMKDRLKQMIGGRAKQVRVCTFHSFCVRVLRQYADRLKYPKNFTIYDASDQLALIKQVAEDQGYDLKKDEYKAILRCISTCKMQNGNFFQLLDAQWGSQTAKEVEPIYQEYQSYLFTNGLMDFDDLLLQTLRLLRTFPDVNAELSTQNRFVMVDEYQDTNRPQYELLQLLTKEHQNLCVVGDDDQSIYGWRGADQRNILDFQKDFPQAKTIKLEQNYRSTSVILEAANQIIANNPNRIDKKLWSSKPQGKKIRWVYEDNDREEVARIAKVLRSETQGQARKYGDYAILYRSNFQSRQIEEALRECQIPYKVKGSLSFYERREIRDVLAYLRVIANSSDEVGLRRAVAFPRRGIGQVSLTKITQIARDNERSLFSTMIYASHIPNLSATAADSMGRFCEMIKHFQNMFEKETLGNAFDALLEHTGFLQALRQEDTDTQTKERRVSCVLELSRGLHFYAERYPDATLKNYLERIALFQNEDRSDDAQQNLVTLATYHSVKGLEYPYVFMTSMVDESFPNKIAMQEQRMEEERRLCYVGMTRACEELTLSAYRTKRRYKETINCQPSCFVKDLSANLFQNPPHFICTKEEKARATESARADFFAKFKQ